MDKVVFTHNAVIMDACCTTNLYASGRIEEIITSFACKFFIADYVKEKEVTTIVKGVNQANEVEREPINLQPLIERGVITIVSPVGEIEHADILKFMYEYFDDAEAITGAIAKNRNWSIATDNAKGIETFKRDISPTRIITTPELVKYWYDRCQPSVDTLHIVINNIRYKGGYQPHSEHPLYAWWRRYS